MGPNKGGPAWQGIKVFLEGGVFLHSLKVLSLTCIPVPILVPLSAPSQFSFLPAVLA